MPTSFSLKNSKYPKTERWCLQLYDQLFTKLYFDVTEFHKKIFPNGQEKYAKKKVSKVHLKKFLVSCVPTVVVSPSSPFMTLEIVISFL